MNEKQREFLILALWIAWRAGICTWAVGLAAIMAALIGMIGTPGEHLGDALTGLLWRAPAFSAIAAFAEHYLILGDD